MRLYIIILTKKVNEITIHSNGTFFYRTSDNASHVVINGTIVVNNRGRHGSRTIQGQIYLNSGTVNKIEIYFD